MKYGTAPKRAVGEKTDAIFGFRMKKCISLRLVFFIFEAQIQFYREIKKNFKKKSQNFNDFFNFEVQYLQSRSSDFDNFFCKLLTILFPFKIKKIF